MHAPTPNTPLGVGVVDLVHGVGEALPQVPQLVLPGRQLLLDGDVLTVGPRATGGAGRTMISSVRFEVLPLGADVNDGNILQ